MKLRPKLRPSCQRDDAAFRGRLRANLCAEAGQHAWQDEEHGVHERLLRMRSRLRGNVMPRNFTSDAT